jgi:uncharacterized protein (TIGR00251 family)
LIRERAGGVQIDIQVIPRSRKTELAGSRGGRLLVRLTAPPVEGAANARLVEFLSDLLGVPKRAVRIAAGEQSRHKTVTVEGVSEAHARIRLFQRAPGSNDTSS